MDNPARRITRSMAKVGLTVKEENAQGWTDRWETFRSYDSIKKEVDPDRRITRSMAKVVLSVKEETAEGWTDRRKTLRSYDRFKKEVVPAIIFQGEPIPSTSGLNHKVDIEVPGFRVKIYKPLKSLRGVPLKDREDLSEAAFAKRHAPLERREKRYR